MRSAWQLTPLEAASGMTFGLSDIEPLPEHDALGGPRAAFEAAVREALLRPPCVISFSGGRDSSAVLAVAVYLARREGHPPPIALTLRFPGVDGTDEDEWQRLVVDHLGVDDWVRHDLRDEIDLLGPAAQSVFARHGVLFPCNAHFHEPVAAVARGGAVLTGVGGDEALDLEFTWERVNRLARREIAISLRELGRLGLAYSPRPVRRRVLRRVPDAWPPCTWLRPDAAREVVRRRAADVADQPVRFDDAVRQFLHTSRDQAVTLQSLELVAAGHGTLARHPFADGRFLTAYAAAAGRSRPYGRTQAMTALFGDLLPARVLARESKAVFEHAFWGPACRDFAREWDGDGLTADVAALVRLDVVGRMWREFVPGESDTRTLILLQSAWHGLHRPAGDAASA